ncbi:MAG: metallophosphoesterase family protein [Phycisphaerales bacterium]
MDRPIFNRREALRIGLAGAAGLVTACGRGSAAVSITPRVPAQAGTAKPGVRLAHLTDFHVQPEKRAGEGMAASLRHVMALDQRPDVIVTGGDLIMDGFEQDESRTRLQWDLFTKVLKDECPARVEHALGNHDIWGWNKSKSRTTGTEPGWGKKWALETLGMTRAYHSFVVGGWRVIVLDSVAVDPRNPDGYIGRLDEAQTAWLEAELKASLEPVVVVSHIPILSMVSVAHSSKTNEKDLQIEVSARVMHADGPSLHRMFAAGAGAGKVKLCLSGHIHRIDRVELDGVAYICDGAVCGSWWNGPRNRCDEGYGVVDLMPDGTFTHRYQTYGWKAEAEA